MFLIFGLLCGDAERPIAGEESSFQELCIFAPEYEL